MTKRRKKETEEAAHTPYCAGYNATSNVCAGCARNEEGKFRACFKKGGKK